MTNTLRNIALRITLTLLCGLVLLNAYLVAKNLKLIQKTATQRMEASDVQADISNVVVDLQEMEANQRGYLITGDPSYLKPYSEANGRLAAHLAELHSTLVGKTPQDRSLESLAELKIEEMNETIHLRELGYRHKAFQIVSSSRGKELMDEARTSLDALAAAQTRNISRYDAQMRENIGTAIKELVFASCLLLAVTVVTLLAFDRYRKRLEIKCARHAEELQATTLQLEQFTSTIFNDVRVLVGKMRSYASALLDVYGGFLPRQGQEKAERIENEAGQMIRLLDDLFKNSAPGSSPKVIDAQPLQRLSA
jgi:CHASE3 domain sensor protein